MGDIPEPEKPVEASSEKIEESETSFETLKIPEKEPSGIVSEESEVKPKRKKKTMSHSSLKFTQFQSIYRLMLNRYKTLIVLLKSLKLPLKIIKSQKILRLLISTKIMEILLSLQKQVPKKNRKERRKKFDLK